MSAESDLVPYDILSLALDIGSLIPWQNIVNCSRRLGHVRPF